MFGITAFAQAPFAALGGTTYAVATDESFTLSDTFDVLAAFNPSNDESFALFDSDGTATFNFFVDSTDSFSLATDELGYWNTSASLAEFFTYRSIVRDIVLNPTYDAVFPETPNEQWSTT